MSGIEPSHRIGTVLRQSYHISRLIGEGGMGAVFEAVHMPSGQRVAIKLLKPALVADPEMVRRFTLEARAASACVHHHVVQVLDTGYTDDGAPFMTLGYLDGETLAERLYKKGRFQDREVAQLLGPVMNALAMIHQRGIVHRDVKPDNIFLARDARGRELPVLMDFGAAGFLQEPEDRIGWSPGSALIGTPAYMAPEQAAGQAGADPRADVYSMGVVMYELLTGISPYQRINHEASLHAILNEGVRSPSQIVPQVSPAMEAVVLTAMSRDPEYRFPSMEVLLSAVQDALMDPNGSAALRRYPLAERVISARVRAPMPSGMVSAGAEFADKRARTVMIKLDQNEPGDGRALGQAKPSYAWARYLGWIAAILLFASGMGMLVFALVSRHRS